MSNFIGYMDGYERTKNDKVWDLYRKMMDRSFPASINNMLKKERERIYEVYELAQTNNDAANELIRQIYKDNGLDIEGDDNAICYAIGDKITIALGRKPVIRYEE